jgi:hypothetical protein
MWIKIISESAGTIIVLEGMYSFSRRMHIVMCCTSYAVWRFGQNVCLRMSEYCSIYALSGMCLCVDKRYTNQLETLQLQRLCIASTRRCLTKVRIHGASGEILCWRTSSHARCLYKATPSFRKVWPLADCLCTCVKFLHGFHVETWLFWKG